MFCLESWWGRKTTVNPFTYEVCASQQPMAAAAGALRLSTLIKHMTRPRSNVQTINAGK